MAWNLTVAESSGEQGVTAGAAIRTDTPTVQQTRLGAVELLLVNHHRGTIDCEEGEACELPQDQVAAAAAEPALAAPEAPEAPEAAQALIVDAGLCAGPEELARLLEGRRAAANLPRRPHARRRFPERLRLPDRRPDRRGRAARRRAARRLRAEGPQPGRARPHRHRADRTCRPRAPRPDRSAH